MSKKNVQEILPLSAVQQGMLFHSLYEPDGTTYIEQYAFPVGDINPDVFARSVQELAARHTVLRTAFVWRNLRNPVQVVHKKGTVTIPVHLEDWTDQEAPEREKRLLEFRRAERVRGFDLTKAPVIRVALLRLESDLWWTVWTYHHLILDGWSASLMSGEIQELARADVTGEAPKLPPTRPFSDFIRWYKRQNVDAARDFWQQTLAGIDEPTPLGIDRPAGGDDTTEGERFNTIHRRLPLAAGGAAIAFSRRQRITMPTMVQAAWALVLSRYSGRDDLVYGLTVSGRPHDLPGVQQMLGCFINTLPMRVKTARDNRVSDWLQTIQKSQRALRPFEHSPLVEVRGWSDMPSDRQLFESIVVNEGFGGDTAGGGAAGDLLAFRTNYALGIGALPDAESITFAIGTDRHRISDAAAERLLDHLERAFTWIVNTPDAHLGAFTLTDEVAVELQAFPSPDLIHERFARQAAATPDAGALVFEDAQLDYRSLEQAANRLAHHLRRHAVGPETLVGVMLERSLDMVVAILGVLKAGGAYLPLDPSLPEDRLAFIIDDAVAATGLDVVVTQDALADHLATKTSLTLVRIDADQEAIASEPADAPAGASVDPDQMAYVIYTSGSTGKPKGTVITHRNVIRLFDATEPWFHLDANDVWTLFHSYAFDFSVWELWGPLINGGKLIIVPYWVSRNPEAMVRLLDQHSVTVLNQTPTAFRGLVAAHRDAEDPPSLDRLRTVIFGGEALDVSTVGPWLETLGPGGFEPVNMYGITETTVHVSYRPVTHEDLVHPQISPIGVPIPDLGIHLLDDRGHAVPVGVPGEIYVAGEGLARGYLARPTLTAQRFVPDSLSTRPGARLYRSGDLARRRTNGEVEFIGRADDQVKIRGFRIELGEIEATLACHPGIRHAVVLAPAGDDGERRLVAWVVGNDDALPTSETLREYLLAQLPDYMVPSVFTPLDALPLTANGKLDHRALPAPDLEATAQAAFVAPEGPTEALVASLWCDLLGVQRVGAHDDFFALGGHSLLATSLAGRLRKVFEVEVPLRALFEAPTVSGMAAQVTALQQAGGAAIPPLVAAPADAPKQLSFAQERLWFLDKFEPDNPWYNIPAAVRLRGQLDPEGFADALSGVLARHEALRTHFCESDGRPIAVVAPPSPMALPVVDLEPLTGDEQEAAIRQQIGAEVARTFDLKHDPLMRALLLRCAEDEHILVLTMHHIASDEWSMGVLVREVTLGYGAFLEQKQAEGDEPAGTATAIAAPPIQYADFAHWQRSWLSGDTLEAQITYWRDQLGDAPPLLELPTDRPRPRTPSYRGGSETALLPATVAEPLRALGQKHGATTFMTALAAFAVVLGRHAGQQDVVIGTPTANRGRVELEPLIGFFVNTLALRVRFDDDPTFSELLARARKTLLAAHAAQDLPFEQLMQTLDPERSLSHAPIFQVMLVMQNAPPEAAPLSGLEAEALPASAGTSKFDLTLNVSDTGDGNLVTRLVYASDLFNATTAQRILAHLHTLLAEVTSAPNRPVSTIPLLGTEERQNILTTWSRPREDFETVATLHALVEQQVERTPGAIAVIHEAGSIAYDQLEREANQLAHHLLQQGAGPDAVVGIALDRSPELVVGVLAILKTGAGYLPLDPSLPEDRLAFMVADTQASLVVTSSSLAPLIPAGEARLVQVDQDADAIARNPETAPQVLVDAANIAYIIFTSGSTGEPKGVAIPHGAVANRMQWVKQVDLDAPPRFLQKSSIGFDVSVAEIFAPLVAGGCTVLPKPGGTRDTSYLLDLIARTEVTHTSFPPSLLNVLLEEPTFVARATSLRSVIVGGEAVPPDLPGRFYPKLPDAVLENRYGPTEATISVTTWPCPNDPERAVEAILPIGLPISKAEVYVVDKRGEPAPVGTPGEIWIGGGCLARGYVARPTLTANTFIPNPFSSDPGQRLYRTGDLGRWRDDGALLFVGRIDQQVKIRGFRVELGEIEATLALQTGVGPNAVTVRGESNEEQRLVAFWVPDPETGERPSRERLHQTLAQTLPNYMVPSVFVELDALPMTPSGKVDRKALGRLTLPETSRGEASPLSPTESLVADLWCEALEVPRVHAHDDFFALGGHSLLASVLLARLRNLFEIEIPLRDLFEASTLRGMAQRVEAAQRAGEGLQTPPLLPAPADAPMALSFAQERLWFLDKLQPGNPWYNIPAAVRLRGDLDPEGFARALTEVVERHHVLRTRFGEANGNPQPVVDPPMAFDLPIIDLSDLVGDEREAAVQRSIDTESAKPFDLARGPLLRAILLRCSATEHVLIVTMHHIVSDEWSAGVLVRELAQGYDAHAEGQSASSVPPLAIQYADFAHWQRGWLQGDVLDEQIAYWRDQLANAPPILELPTDRPRPQAASYRGGTDKALIPASIAEPLRALGRAHGATMFMTSLAAFAVVLGRYAGQKDVVIGSPIANRGRVELEPLIGFFVNTLALRVRFDDDPTFPELLARARKTLLGAHAAQDLPFEQLVQALDPERSLSHAPLFQVMLVVQSGQTRSSSLASLEAESMMASPGTSKFDLTLTIADAGEGGLLARLVYATDLFSARTAQRILAHVTNFLSEVASEPDRPVSEIAIIGADERQRILGNWSRPREDFETVTVLHTLVEQQAKRTPDETAVLHDAGSLIYRDLEQQANRLAHHLRDRGAGSGKVIGIALEPSPDRVVGILAILKTGAAYLPLDPGYPEDRLTFMITDARASLVVTSASVVERLPTTDAPVVVLEQEAQATAGHPTTAPNVAVDAADIAYIIYTSGSTGQPKGVAVGHSAVANRMQWVRQVDLDTPPRFLQKSSICFDVSVAEIFAPLVTGGCCVLPKPGGTQDTGYLLDLIARAKVTHTSFPPSLLGVLLEQPTFVARAATLRSVVVGGETVPPELAARFYAKLPGAVLENRYGPTEATISVTSWSCPNDPKEFAEAILPIGLPISKAEVYVVDQQGEPAPVGIPGEIMIGGGCLARGYLGRPALNASAFIPHPFTNEPGQRLYRTGDLGRWRDDGALLFVGRVDQQVKIRGFRIELGEIETTLATEPSVREAAVLAHDVEGPVTTDRRLAAFVVGSEDEPASPDVLRDFLRDRLPYYMVPSRFEVLPALPLTTSGKVDRSALLAHLENQPDPSASGSGASTPPSNTLERAIATVWQDVLGIQEVNAEDSFFDLGGHSLLLTQVHARLRDEHNLDLSMMDLFQYPTIRTLARHVGTAAVVGEVADVGGIDARDRAASRRGDRETTDIAVIAMNGRFPGAPNVDQLWENLREGVDAITRHSPDALREAGVPEAELAHPNFVPASMILPNIDLFDAKFFDYAPREAQVIDPQQRIFLEIAWEAFERAGYDTTRFKDRVAVYAGVGSNTYQLNLFSQPGLLRNIGMFQMGISNEKDFLTTRVSYKLGLRGPSVNVQCACSTSLVAVALACDSLVEHRADMALAGGVTIRTSAMSPNGYLFEDGGITSHDGRTRTFDADSTGTVGGSGAGVVLLKRLSDAERDGDQVHAVIKGWAINNDGADKIGWTAPGVSGQVEVIREALADANVEPKSVGYVEAHGTATALGDPIEVEALNQAYDLADAPNSCAIGSIKSNIGHLDTAAGVSGLIKAVLALEHQAIPPSLHMETPNPRVPFEEGPFFVNTKLRPWEANGRPRRAAVSALGIGGTNAHLVLQEARNAPDSASVAGRDPDAAATAEQLLLLSAKTRSALESATGNLARHLESHRELALADVAFTLQVGRQIMPYRRALVARDVDEAISLLDDPTEAGVMSAKQASVNRPVVFLFPGGGAQHRRMGHDLYAAEPTYRNEIDRCAALFEQHMGYDFRVTLFAEDGPETEEADARLRRTSFALPTLFATEYALARLLMDRGIAPRAMIGHSLGEYTAAAIAGVLSLEDATRLVAARANLFESLPLGTMLSVNLPVDELTPMLGDELAIAAVNTPTLCVASGPVAAIDTLAAKLEDREIEHSLIHIDVAAHSPMVEPILEEFAAEADQIEAHAPAIPYLSNVTGTWITDDDVSLPNYWPQHLRSTVRFAEGLTELLARDEDVVLLEIGPGKTLSTLARQHPARPGSTPVRTTMRHPREVRSDTAFLRQTLGRLWLDGVHIDWFGGVAQGTRRRVVLPTYPFERKRHWIDAPLLRKPSEATESTLPMPAPLPITETPDTATPGELDDLDAYVAPRNDAERQLAALWQDLLGVERIGIHDDFFELGGSSLMAVRLGTRLRAQLETELSPHFLLEAPTVALLAAQLADSQDASASEKDAEPSNILVPMNTTQSQERPLVLIHPVGGHVYFYRDVAKAIGPQVPIFAIPARGLEHDETPINDLRVMATHYVEQLRAVQPVGPYRLGGSSMGGMVAYEMAQQLVRLGEKVELLALLDTAILPTDPDKPIDDDAVLKYLVRSRTERGWLSDIEGDDLEAKLQAIIKQAQSIGALPDGVDAHHVVNLTRCNFEAMAGYQPQPYPGTLTFYRARDRKPTDPQQPESPWIELAGGGTEVHIVPGDHITMHHPPNLSVLAERIRQALDRLSNARRR